MLNSVTPAADMSKTEINFLVLNVKALISGVETIWILMPFKKLLNIIWIYDYLLVMNIWCDAITHRVSLFLYSVYIIQPCTSLTSTVSLLSNDTWIHRVHKSELMTFWSTTELELVETHCCVKILTKMSDKVSNRSPGQSFDSNY